MSRPIKSFLITIAILFGAFLMEPLFPLGDWRWGALALIAISPIAYSYRNEIKTWIINRFSIRIKISNPTKAIDSGRGDLIAVSISQAKSFHIAKEEFNNCRYDANPRRLDLAWNALVEYLKAEGRTDETMEFLRGENLANFPAAENPSEGYSAENQYLMAVTEFWFRGKEYEE